MTGIEIRINGKPIEELSNYSGTLVIDLPVGAHVVEEKGVKHIELSSIFVPPSGKCRVTNFYVDKVTHKLVVEYDDGVM